MHLSTQRPRTPPTKTHSRATNQTARSLASTRTCPRDSARTTKLPLNPSALFRTNTRIHGKTCRSCQPRLSPFRRVAHVECARHHRRRHTVHFVQHPPPQRAHSARQRCIRTPPPPVAAPMAFTSPVGAVGTTGEMKVFVQSEYECDTGRSEVRRRSPEQAASAVLACAALIDPLIHALAPCSPCTHVSGWARAPSLCISSRVHRQEKKDGRRSTRC